ncbi:hypothetical protein [Phenylobacterium sp.]|uniref:pyroglutamyl-peptidase I family protein n=1 Tax=Phenylobacterium sp. TaxID=1871053 RepID=UPI00271BDA88|nr:hypothetical protein [Phenylobacterium sp.]MDO8799825.1 hypothetical protein [Phenylobacterium sp.]
MTQPRLLVCGFGSFPAAPRNPSGAIIEGLAREAWAPPGFEVEYLTLPVAWTGSVEAIQDVLAERAADAVLVVGVATESDAFRVETMGRNRAGRAKPDDRGETWEGSLIKPDGPGALAATAPTAEILDALIGSHLAARLSDDAGDYLCNFTLYRLLAEQAAPSVAFLHVPQAREFADGASGSLLEVDQAVRASIRAMASAISRPAAERRTA